MSVPSKLTAPVTGKRQHDKRRGAGQPDQSQPHQPHQPHQHHHQPHQRYERHGQHEQPSMAADFLAGCVGGVAGVVVGHPLDTVKVHMQMNGARYSSTLVCMRALIAQHSVRGLYRGISSPMGGVAFVNAVVFGVYGSVTRQATNPDSPLVQAAAGGAAGLAQATVCAPMELAKTRLQLGLTKDGPLRCLAEVARADGPRAVFRGLGITALRDAPGFSSYFLCFELLSRRSDGTPCGAVQTLLAGGVAGMVSWIVTYPIDVVKSRLQADGADGPRRYAGSLDCLRQGLAAEGRGFLWRGLGSVLLRAFPTNAACFGAVTACLRLAERPVEERPPRWTAHCGPECAAQAYRSLLFAGAFSEAICAGDILELHEDFASAAARVASPGVLHLGLAAPS